MWLRISLFSALLAGSASSCVRADEFREVQRDGVVWRERIATVRRPVAEMRYRERQETVYREKTTAKTQEFSRTYFVPVTQYYYQQRVQDWWNPFRPTTVSYQPVPYVHWSPRTEKVSRPVTVREMVPEKRIVRQPERILSFVNEKQVVDRVVVRDTRRPANTAIATVPSRAPVSVAQQPIVGGFRMQSDPPRYGTAPTIVR